MFDDKTKSGAYANIFFNINKLATIATFAGVSLCFFGCEKDKSETKELEFTCEGRLPDAGNSEQPELQEQEVLTDGTLGRQGGSRGYGGRFEEGRGRHLEHQHKPGRRRRRKVHAGRGRGGRRCGYAAFHRQQEPCRATCGDQVREGARNRELRIRRPVQGRGHGAGAAENDPLWRMPLWRPYETMLDSKVADLNNVATGGHGGAITAALFLRRFVTTKSWLHFDIFAWTPTAKPGRPEGAECQTARALYALLCARYS